MSDMTNREPFPFMNYKFVNLNKNSTHPNPWRPPNEFEMNSITFYDPLRIREKGEWNVRWPVPLEEDPFFDSLGFWGWTGFKFGAWVGFSQSYMLMSCDCWRTIFARMGFVGPVFGSMATSYVAFRHFLGTQSKKKNSLWTYPAAVAAPASINAIYRSDPYAFFRMMAWGGFFSYGYKMVHQYAWLSKDTIGVPWSSAAMWQLGNTIDRLPNDPDLGTADPMSLDVNHWKSKGHIFEGFGKVAVEPGWKKWLDPKDRDKGPEV